MSKEYITYGFYKFQPQKMRYDILDAMPYINKPNGFWASPVDANHSWANWCEAEGFGILSEGTENVNYIKFKLKNAKVYTIKNLKDLLGLPLNEIKTPFSGQFFMGSVNYERLRTMGYDGVELCMDNYRFGHMFGAHPRTEEDKKLSEEELDRAANIEHIFNSWDCDSIVIWNPDVIEVIEEKCFNKTDCELFYDGYNFKDENGKALSPEVYKNATSIIVEDGIKELSDEAFSRFFDLREVYLPNGLESIGISTFYNCESLKEIVIPNSVKKIGYNAFVGCEELQYIKIPDNIKKINPGMFKNTNEDLCIDFKDYNIKPVVDQTPTNKNPIEIVNYLLKNNMSIRDYKAPIEEEKSTKPYNYKDIELRQKIFEKLNEEEMKTITSNGLLHEKITNIIQKLTPIDKDLTKKINDILNKVENNNLEIPTNNNINKKDER